MTWKSTWGNQKSTKPNYSSSYASYYSTNYSSYNSSNYGFRKKPSSDSNTFSSETSYSNYPTPVDPPPAESFTSKTPTEASTTPNSFKDQSLTTAETNPTEAKLTSNSKTPEPSTDKPDTSTKKEKVKKAKKPDKKQHKKAHKKKISKSIPIPLPFFPPQVPLFNILQPQQAPLSIESFENEILDDSDQIISQILGSQISEEEIDQFSDRLLTIVKKHVQTCIALNRQNSPQGQIGSFNQFGGFGLNSPFMSQNIGYGQMSQGMFPQNLGFNQQFMNQGMMMRPFQ